jgi:hypothetical protein
MSDALHKGAIVMTLTPLIGPFLLGFAYLRSMGSITGRCLSMSDGTVEDERQGLLASTVPVHHITLHHIMR